MEKFWQINLGNIITIGSYLFIFGAFFQRFKHTERAVDDLKELPQKLAAMDAKLHDIEKKLDNYHMRLREVEKMDVAIEIVKGDLKTIKAVLNIVAAKLGVSDTRGPKLE